MATAYCPVCGQRADEKIRRGAHVFCSEAHAEEFEREVAAIGASRKASSSSG